MRKTTFLMLLLPLLVLTTACQHGLVTMKYRPVAQFIGLNTPQNSGGLPAFSGENHIWVYYRIDSIDTTDPKVTAPFALDYSRFYVLNDDGTQSPSVPTANNFHGLLTLLPFHQSIAAVPPQQVKVFPAGPDNDPAPRLIVWQMRTTGYEKLKYRPVKGQPAVLLVRDTSAPPPFDPKDTPITNKNIHDLK